MRILQVEKFFDSSSATAGGVGRYIQTLGGHLRGRGHEVFSFGCAGPEGPAHAPAFFDFTETRSPLALLRMIHNPQAEAKMADFLRGNPVEVAHLHNIYHHLTPSILPVLGRRGVGIVMTMHDYRQVGRERLFWRWGMGDTNYGAEDRFFLTARGHCTGLGGMALAIESWVQRLWRRYIRWVSFFLCPTEYMRSVAQKTGIPKGKLVVVRNPIAVPKMPDVKSASDTGGTLLFAGRLGPEKSPHMMLRLAEKFPKVKVVLAGDGPEMETLQKTVRKCDLQNVELLGHVRSEKMGELYAKAAAVVVSSRCMENSPATMLEAMAAGRCVIAPDQPPLREWVIDGRTGWLFATGDIESLEQVTARVLADEGQRRKVGAAARREVLRRHDAKKQIDRIEHLYQAARRQ
ncbi:MAG TPA: glycosyltransferase family 1 protein, partial [Phycisphaerae bacterium]|nr:glycosyltransferase family 1 protein [Phycisphaerae bacterium]